MTELISQSEIEYLTDLELRSKFNEVAGELARQEEECQELVALLRKIQAVIHCRRY